LDLGLTQKEIIRYLKERLISLGETGDVQISNIDMNPFNNKNNNSISV
jgi:hypothetical protein